MEAVEAVQQPHLGSGRPQERTQLQESQRFQPEVVGAVVVRRRVDQEYPERPAPAGHRAAG